MSGGREGCREGGREGEPIEEGASHRGRDERLLMTTIKQGMKR